MDNSLGEDVVTLQENEAVFEKAFAAYSVVLIGTHEEDGSTDLAPKHMITPLGWDDYFGFVCTPEHSTFQNVKRTEEFTVSYPRPEQIVSVSLSAEPRSGDDKKPDLNELDTVPATAVEAECLQDAYIYLECTLEGISQDFGENNLIAGNIVAKHVHSDALRSTDRDDNDVINQNPLLTYLHPGRYSTIDDSNAFPFPKDFHR
ncbi:MAG: flavin reductase [bacterium]